MNRTAFLVALRARIVANYGGPRGDEPATRLNSWAADTAKLDAFMAQTVETMTTARNIVMIETPSFVEAWRAIGGKGKPTYKALRALPVA